MERWKEGETDVEEKEKQRDVKMDRQINREMKRWISRSRFGET